MQPRSTLGILVPSYALAWGFPGSNFSFRAPSSTSAHRPIGSILAPRSPGSNMGHRPVGFSGLSCPTGSALSTIATSFQDLRCALSLHPYCSVWLLLASGYTMVPTCSVITAVLWCPGSASATRRWDSPLVSWSFIVAWASTLHMFTSASHVYTLAPSSIGSARDRLPHGHLLDCARILLASHSSSLHRSFRCLLVLELFCLSVCLSVCLSIYLSSYLLFCLYLLNYKYCLVLHFCQIYSYFMN